MIHSHIKKCVWTHCWPIRWFSMSKSHGSAETASSSSLLLSQVAEKILASSPVTRTKSLTEPSETKTREQARASATPWTWPWNWRTACEWQASNAIEVHSEKNSTKLGLHPLLSAAELGLHPLLARRFAETKESHRLERVASSYHSHPRPWDIDWDICNRKVPRNNYTYIYVYTYILEETYDDYDYDKLWHMTYDCFMTVSRLFHDIWWLWFPECSALRTRGSFVGWTKASGAKPSNEVVVQFAGCLSVSLNSWWMVSKDVKGNFWLSSVII